MWNKIHGFFSTVALYYLLIVSVLILIETTLIVQNLHTLENLKLTIEPITASHSLMAALRCAIWNHESYGYLNESNVTLEFETNFESESGNATLCSIGCTTFTYSFDFDNLTDFQIRVLD